MLSVCGTTRRFGLSLWALEYLEVRHISGAPRVVCSCFCPPCLPSFSAPLISDANARYFSPSAISSIDSRRDVNLQYCNVCCNFTGVLKSLTLTSIWSHRSRESFFQKLEAVQFRTQVHLPRFLADIERAVNEADMTECLGEIAELSPRLRVEFL
jgi:hypothetical protein